jgi:hypothetical protein
VCVYVCEYAVEDQSTAANPDMLCVCVCMCVCVCVYVSMRWKIRAQLQTLVIRILHNVTLHHTTLRYIYIFDNDYKFFQMY